MHIIPTVVGADGGKLIKKDERKSGFSKYPNGGSLLNPFNDIDNALISTKIRMTNDHECFSPTTIFIRFNFLKNFQFFDDFGNVDELTSVNFL